MKKRILWIDGMKGIACIGILIHHFFVGFLPATYYGADAVSHLQTNFEETFSQSPFSFILNGNFWVCIFCIVSAFLLSYKVMNNDKKEKVSTSILNRYFKLVLPLFIVSLIVYLLLSLNLFRNIAASDITKSTWLASYYNHEETFINVLKTSFIDVWFIGNSDFSTAFWMLSILFNGGIVAIVLSEIQWKFGKKSIIFYIIISFIFLYLKSYFLVFSLGVIIAYLFKYNYTLKKHKIIPIFLILFGIILAGFPSGVEPTNFYKYLNFEATEYGKDVIWHIFASALVMYGIMNIDLIKKILSCNILKKLGSISYSIYLIHIPIMFSVSSYMFIKLYEITNKYIFTFAITLICTIVLTIILGYLYNIIIEKNINRFINYCYEKLSPKEEKKLLS